MKPRPHWIFLWAIVGHLISAVACAVYPGALQATPTYGLIAITGERWYLAAAWMALVALMALVGLLRRSFNGISILWMLPQQFTLIISAAGSLGAIVSGHYSDGAARNPAFILTDQVWSIAGVLIHTIALVEAYAGGPWNRLSGWVASGSWSRWRRSSSRG